LTVAELHQLAEALPVQYRAMVYLAGVLGLRWSEVVGLRVGAIDFLRRRTNISQTVAEVEGMLMEEAPVKTRASYRSINSPVEMINLLAEQLGRVGRSDPAALVFQAPGGGPLRAGNFRNRVWYPAVKKAGLDGLTFHSLRHTSVGFMVAARAHPLIIQRRVGHASINTTFDIYGPDLPEMDEGVAEVLGTLIFGADSAAAEKTEANPASPRRPQAKGSQPRP
jgi:integrase